MRSFVLAVAIVPVLMAGSSDALGAPPQKSDLVQAVERGDLSAVQALIATGSSVNQRNHCDDAPLTAAVRAGHPDIVQALLKAGARIDYRGSCPVPQESVLCIAAEQGRLESVRLLTEAGAPPNGHDPMGRTPLMCAAGAGNLDAMAFLLRNGADIHATESALNIFPPPIDTALMHAASKGRWQAVELLLEAGARVNDKGQGDFTALAYAVRESFFKPVREANPRDYPATVRILLALGADPNAAVKDDRRSTPLALAVRRDKAPLLALLLEAGASPNSRGAGGETPLMIAVKRGDLETVRLLVGKGGDSSITDEEGRNSVQLARMAAFRDIEQFLLSGNAPYVARRNSSPASPNLAPQQVKPVWMSGLGERASGGPWLLDDKVLYHTYGGRLIALSAQNGARLWEARTDGPQISTPVLDQGLLYFGTAKDVFALRLSNGQKVWQYPKSIASSGELVVDGRAVYVNSARNFHAIDRSTGKELWRLRADGAGTYTPVMAGSTVLVGNVEGRLIAVEAQSGRVKWESSVAAGSAIGDEFLREAGRAARTREARDMFEGMGPRDLVPFAKGVCDSLLQGQTESDVVANLAEFWGPDVAAAIATAARKILCPAGTTREQMAVVARNLESPKGNETLASLPSIHGDSVVFRTKADLDSGSIRLVELESGRIVMHWPTHTGGGSAPVIDDAAVYFTDRGELVARAKDGAKLWLLDLQYEGGGYDAPLVLIGKHLYVLGRSSILEIDRTAGTIIRRIPITASTELVGNLLRGEPRLCALGLEFAFMEEMSSSEAGWVVPLTEIRGSGRTLACTNHMLFYYVDGGDYPAYGVEVLSRVQPGN